MAQAANPSAGRATRGAWLHSITASLAAIVIAFVCAIALLLAIVVQCFGVARGVRAYVGAEGLWSKGQKDAVFYLQRYAGSHDPHDYRKYLAAVAVPLGDRKARLELEQRPGFRREVVERGFTEGGVAAEDIPAMIDLFRRYRNVGYLDRAIAAWAGGDAEIATLMRLAQELHSGIAAGNLGEQRARELLDAIEHVNRRVTALETEFSETLAQAARWVERLLRQIILLSAVVLLGGGLWVAWRISRGLRSGIRALREGAERMTAGDLEHRIELASRDELGALAAAFNEMMLRRRDAESQLKLSMELSRSVIDTAYDAFVAMDAAGMVIDWNRRAERTFGWARDQAMGRPLADLIIPPQHRAGHWRGLERYLATGEGPMLNQRIDISAQHRDGREFPVELTIWALKVGGVQRFNAFLHDISERHRMVRRLAAQKVAAAALVEAPTLSEAAPALLQAVCEALHWDLGAIWIPDQAAGVLRCAHVWHRPGRSFAVFEKAAREIGFAPGAGLPGRIWSSRQPAWIPDVTQDGNFPRSGVAGEEGLHGAFGFPIVSGSDTLGVVEFFSNEIQEPDEDLLRMMGTLGSLLGQFIERRRAEAELAARMADLARSNAELERFAYVASHDLQEPLRTVGSFAQLLARLPAAKSEPAAEQYVGFIIDAVKRMRALLQGLLDYSRTGRAEENAVAVELDGLLDAVLSSLKDAVARSGASVSRDPLPRLTVHPQQIEQLLQNLIGNALKFVDAAAPRVHVSAAHQGPEWVFSVRDNGIGIEPRHAERIFELFERLHTRDQFPGSGLGLAICKKIVERHGGRIWVEAGNPGSVFRFTLPAG